MIHDFVKRDSARPGEHGSILLDDRKLSEIYFVIRNRGAAFNLHADCKKRFTCVCGKVNRRGRPSIRLAGG